MSGFDLVKQFAATFAQRKDGALRIYLDIDRDSFALSPEQAEQLEAALHAATQQAVEQVAREVDRFS